MNILRLYLLCHHCASNYNTYSYTFNFSIQAVDLKAPMDQRIVCHVRHLVGDAVRSVGEMMTHLKLFVRQILPSSHESVMSSNRHYFPSRNDIRRLMYRERVHLMNGLVDEELLAAKIPSWKVDGDSLHFRPYVQTDVGEDDPDTEDDDIRLSCSASGLLLVYQTKWQKVYLSCMGTMCAFLMPLTKQHNMHYHCSSFVCELTLIIVS